jgi:hypothetical protein
MAVIAEPRLAALAVARNERRFIGRWQGVEVIPE